jgi:glycosyltransferase involved in cell wall biosynthesis
MAAMAEFYAEHDVLIAPSIWPESYGLVTREALSAGLWVVASGIGALADPIEHGVNGHVVPPGDPDALGRVLVQLCCEPRSPKPLREPRYHRQAIDRLIPLYDQCQG